MMDQVTHDAIGVMKQGGQSIADEAQGKWWRGEYTDDRKQKLAMIAHWRNVRERIAEMCSGLKSQNA